MAKCSCFEDDSNLAELVEKNSENIINHKTRRSQKGSAVCCSHRLDFCGIHVTL